MPEGPVKDSAKGQCPWNWGLCLAPIHPVQLNASNQRPLYGAVAPKVGMHRFKSKGGRRSDTSHPSHLPVRLTRGASAWAPCFLPASFSADCCGHVPGTCTPQSGGSRISTFCGWELADKGGINASLDEGPGLSRNSWVQKPATPATADGWRIFILLTLPPAFRSSVKNLCVSPASVSAF